MCAVLFFARYDNDGNAAWRNVAIQDRKPGAVQLVNNSSTSAMTAAGTVARGSRISPCHLLSGPASGALRRDWQYPTRSGSVPVQFERPGNRAGPVDRGYLPPVATSSSFSSDTSASLTPFGFDFMLADQVVECRRLTSIT